MYRIPKFLAVFALALLATGTLTAQEGRIIPEVMPCPFPQTITIGGGTVATPIPAEFPAGARPGIVGSVWNQSVANKAFGHTFRFPAPPRECCVMTSGTLTVRVKTVQGAVPGNSDASNDSVNLYTGGNHIAQQLPWTAGASINTTKTLTFPLTANALSTGFLSIYVQDDTAVVSAELVLRGCCLSKRCVDTTLDLSTGANNGTAIAVGATDSHWTVKAPGSSTTAPAVAITRQSPSWFLAPPTAQWISSSATASAPGPYVYTFNFDLGKEWPNRDCRLELQYTGDNDVKLALDGTTFATSSPPSSFNILHTASTNIPSSVGPHALTATVTNISGPTGLLITGKLTCHCKDNP